MKKELGIFVLLIVLCVIVSLINPNFLLAINLQNLARQIGAFGIFSIGLGLVIITGGIELSVGSMMALLGVLMSMMLTEWKLGVIIAVLACAGIAMFLSFIHGLLITRVNMQPFIVTLCGLLFYRGLARFITKDETKGFGTVGGLDFLRFLANGNLFGIPMPFVLLILISIVTWIVLHRSVYGRYLFATGRNPEAARYAGINTRWMITIAYVISGALTAISGIIFAFYTNSVSPANHGNAYELYGIAAAVLGGCSLRGGEGSVIGILIGAALLQVLRNLVNLLGIPSSLDFAVMGAVILLGVMADQILGERRNRRQIVLMRESARADMRAPNAVAADHSGGTGSEPPAVAGG
jgi:ribose transport system permease protein